MFPKLHNSTSRQVTISCFFFYTGAQRKIVRTHGDKAEIVSKAEPAALAFRVFPTSVSYFLSNIRQQWQKLVKSTYRCVPCAPFLLLPSTRGTGCSLQSATQSWHPMHGAQPPCVLWAPLSFGCSWVRAKMLQSASRPPPQPYLRVWGKNLTQGYGLVLWWWRAAWWWTFAPGELHRSQMPWDKA